MTLREHAIVGPPHSQGRRLSNNSIEIFRERRSCMSSPFRSVHEFRHRLVSLLFIKYTVVFAACWLFLWGTTALALRTSELFRAEQLCWGAIGLLLPPLFALVFAKRMLPSDAVLAAILDRENRAGGIFLASLELTSDLTSAGRAGWTTETAVSNHTVSNRAITNQWLGDLPPLAVPGLRWNGSRPFFGLGLGLLFLIVALLVPVQALTAAAGNRLNVEDRVRKLTRQLETLAEEKMLPLEEVDAWKVELEKIQNEAEGVSPVKTQDALDQMADQLEQKAQEAMEETEKKAEALAQAESLLDAFEESLQKGESSGSKEMMEGLAEAIEKMLRENDELRKDIEEELSRDEDGEESESDALTETLQKMLQENQFGEMNAEQLQKLAEAMKNCEGKCEGTLDKLKAGGFKIDPEMLKKMQEARNIGKAELQKMLEELKAGACPAECGECEGCKTLSRCQKQALWDRSAKETGTSQYLESETDEDGSQFRPLTLPPPELEAFRQSQKIGLSTGRPQADSAGASSEQGGAIREI
ncbi:MAG TPA: hypothetical protein DEB39_10385, partial [Planctomycetaceae bacterium]|nr:hypothetical protein [Planctomycetaceae bacterium]